MQPEQQWLLARGYPRSQGQAEGWAGLGKVLAEEALVNQTSWQLSEEWRVTGLGQGWQAACGSLEGFGREHRQLVSTGSLKAPRQQQEAARLPAKSGDSRLLALTGQQSLDSLVEILKGHNNLPGRTRLTLKSISVHIRCLSESLSVSDENLMSETKAFGTSLVD